MLIRFQPCIIFLACFFASVIGSTVVAQQIPEQKILDDQSLQHTPGLNHKIQGEFHEERLDSVLKTISQKTGIRLNVTANLAPRRLTARINNKSAASLLLEIERVLNVSCRKVAQGYELYQTEEQQRSEMRLKRLSVEREEDFLRQQADRLRSQIASALFATGNRRDVFADFLAHCDQSAIDSGIASALEDEPIISASDQSHFHNHFFGVMPFSALAPAQQNAASQIAREGGYKNLSNNSSIGIIAAAGGFQLGIVQPDGKDVWVAPTHTIGGVPGLNAMTRENDFDPKIIPLLQSSQISDIASLPASIGNKKFTMVDTVHNSVLSNLLEDICAKAGIDFVCDCYYHSHITNYGFVFPANSEWTVEHILTQVARTFAHQIRYRGGYIEAVTVVPGLDLRLEPPADVMNVLDSQVAEKRLPTANELLVLSKTSRDQIGMLVLYHSANRFSNQLFNALRFYPFLHFWGMLSKDQQTRAQSASGLSTLEMNRYQLGAFNFLRSAGLTSTTITKLKKSRFYVQTNSPANPAITYGGALVQNWGKPRQTIVFIATLADDTVSCRIGTL